MTSRHAKESAAIITEETHAAMVMKAPLIVAHQNLGPVVGAA